MLSSSLRTVPFSLVALASIGCAANPSNTMPTTPTAAALQNVPASIEVKPDTCSGGIAAASESNTSAAFSELMGVAAEQPAVDPLGGLLLSKGGGRQLNAQSSRIGGIRTLFGLARGLGELTESPLDTQLTDLPTAFTECNGSVNDSMSTFIDDTRPAVVYSYPWKAETPGLGLYQGTQHITNIGGHKVSFTFNTPGGGPSTISYGYRKMRNAGKAAIYWDGQYLSTISLYAPDNVYHCEFTLYDMPPGVHTVRVHVLNQKEPISGGTYVNVDYFRQYDF